jgi:hypothetical protein
MFRIIVLVSVISCKHDQKEEPPEVEVISSAAPALSLALSPAFSTATPISDLAYSSAIDRFLVSSSSDAGGIYGFDETTSTLPADALEVWAGSSATANLGARISLFDHLGVSYIASGETGSSYAGRWLVKPIVAGFQGTMLADATLDLSGQQEGESSTGGRFGYASAIVGNYLIVTAPSEDPTGYALPVSALTEGVTDAPAPIGLDGDSPFAGGAGMTGTSIAVLDGALFGSYDGAAQHLQSNLIPNWYVTATGRTDGTMEHGSDRDTSNWSYVSVYDGGFALHLLSAGATTASTVLVTEDGVVSEAPPSTWSVAEGRTEDGLGWTAWGVLTCEPITDAPSVARAVPRSARVHKPATPQRSGPSLGRPDAQPLAEIKSCEMRSHIYLRRSDKQEAIVSGPSTGECFLRLASNGKSKLAWACEGGSAGGIGVVR